MQLTTTDKQKLHNRLDVVGFVASAACAVHCLAMPLLISVLPLLGLSFLLDPVMERALVILSIVIAGCSLYWGYRQHRKFGLLIVFAIAAASLVAGMFFFDHGHLGTSSPFINQFQMDIQQDVRPQDVPAGLFFLVIGGSAIAFSHWLNRRLCKSCATCEHDHE